MTKYTSIYSIGALKARMQGSTRVLKKPQNIYIYEDHMNEKKGFFFTVSRIMELNSNNKHSNKKCQVKITRNINLVVKFVTVQNKLKAKTRCGKKTCQLTEIKI